MISGTPLLVLATRNRHKLEELRALLARDGIPPERVAALPDGPPVEEDGSTFEENAVKKAVSAALGTGCWALADDSGLEVESLGGEPGVRSARYAGDGAGDARNNAKLLETLSGGLPRRARFRCVLALCRPDGTFRTVSGSCEGGILDAPRGEQGFGYDPLFLPDGFDRSFAELEPGEKNRISHRARAWATARAAWFTRSFPPADFEETP